MIELFAHEGRIKICLQAIHIGCDICIIIHGGDKAHIGSISLAHNSMQNQSDTLIIPGHKEDIISSKVVKIIADTMGCAVCCVCGIHVHNITKQEISQVLNMSQKLTLTLIEKLNAHS